MEISRPPNIKHPEYVDSFPTKPWFVNMFYLSKKILPNVHIGFAMV